ncbi:MAG: mechanosensitive ion channel family protein [Desulfobacterales bacterium]
MDDLFHWFDKMIRVSSENLYIQGSLKTFFAIGVSFIVWTVFKRLITSIEKKTGDDGFIGIDSRAIDVIRRVAFYALILVTGTYLIRLFGMTMIEKAFFAVLILLVSLPVKEFVIIALQYFKKNLASKTETMVDDIIFDLLDRFVGVVIIAIAVVLSLDMLGINVMPFIAGAGVAGLAIGFAAKDTLSNLIAGVLLIIDRPFEIGDRIEVWSAPSGSATWGDVIDIGIRATKIKTTDNIVIIIPNNEIMKRDIVNYTISSAQIRVRVDIGVSYDTDIEKAKKVVLNVADTAEWILKTPSPKVVVKSFGESSVDLQLRVWIDDARKRMDTISFITDRVKSAFNKEGIEIPFPRRDIVITHEKKSA